MITPILERLILENKAEYKTHNHGIGGVGTIPNPNNRTIVVTDIIYFPFVHNGGGVNTFPNTAAAFNAFLANGQLIHTLKMQAKQKVCKYTFRDEYNLKTVEDSLYVLPSAPVKVDCYFMAFEDIHINLKSFNIGQIFTDVSKCSSSSKEEQVPLGYGTENDVNASITVKLVTQTDDFGNILNYCPVGKRDSSATLSPENKILDFVGLNAINAAVNADANYAGWPVIQFGYVELYDKYHIESTLRK